MDGEQRLVLSLREHPMKYSENDYNERHVECPEGLSISQADLLAGRLECRETPILPQTHQVLISELLYHRSP